MRHNRFGLLLLALLALSSFAAEAPKAEVCVFCEIIAGTRPASVVYRDASVMAFMTSSPRNPGHVLVVPVAHAQDIFDVPPATLGHMAEVAQLIARAIKLTDLRADGISIQSNTGAVAGQTVFHLHVHVIPRVAGDSQTGTPTAADVLDAVAAKIRAALGRVR